MSSFIPPSFLLRVQYTCPHIKDIPKSSGAKLLDLPASCRLEDFTGMDGKQPFADIRVAWNEFGIAFQAELQGKEQLPKGDTARVRGSDGVTLWLDTRDSRTSHRASRYCHQFHFLPTGAGENHDEPFSMQAKIHRALQDAPVSPAEAWQFQCKTQRTGYLLEAFLPALALSGFDTEQNRRLGFFFAVRDMELGEQLLGLGPEFPYWEDPTLWSVLHLA